jgi:hypothetical protein
MTDYLLGYCNLESVLFKKGVTSPLKFISICLVKLANQNDFSPHMILLEMTGFSVFEGFESFNHMFGILH